MCCSTNCCSIIAQALAAICSMVSTITIINFFRIDDVETRTYIIIIFAIFEFVVQCFKLALPVKHGKDNYLSTAAAMCMTTTTNTKSKAVIIGLVDATFDVIAAIAILNGVDYVDFDATSILITVGTFIGFGEEVTELMIEIFIALMDCCTDGDSTIAFCVTCCFGIVELIGSFIEIGISMYVAAQISDPDASLFVIITITVLSLLFCCLCCGGFAYCWYSCKAMIDGVESNDDVKGEDDGL